MNGDAILQRTTAYQQDAPAIRLLAPQWKLLLAFDGSAPLTEVASRAGMPLPDAITLAGKFLARGWIEEQPISLEQYLKSFGSSAELEIPADDHVPVPSTIPPPPLPVRKPHPGHGPMRLSAVVDYITSLVGNTPLGQILVYRVFLRVPVELLQAEDITTIQLVNDPSLIRTAELQKAISAAVMEVARRPLPDGVYALV